MGSWVYLMIYSAPSLQVEHCLGWLRRWTSNWIMYVWCMYAWGTTETSLLGWLTNIRACVRKDLRLRPLEKQGRGSRSFLLCNFFWFAVCACFYLYIYIFYHFFSYLSLLFSAVLAASYYFTRFCFCLFVCSFLYGLIFFRYTVSLSASFFYSAPS